MQSFVPLLLVMLLVLDVGREAGIPEKTRTSPMKATIGECQTRGLISEDGLIYQTGFGNSFESEVIPGSLPRGRNNPRQVPHNLYAEQLSGTAFTAPRYSNRKIWLYRIQPSVVVSDVKPLNQYFGSQAPAECEIAVNPLRWKPMPMSQNQDFIDGMRLICQGGEPLSKNGIAIYIYSCDKPMTNRHFYDSDGDMLIVPQQGALSIVTEVGRLHVAPSEICVIPRGIVVNISPSPAAATTARGYVLEVYKGGFVLPELGPIGSNGLANARDFCYPVAWCVSKKDYLRPCQIVSKMDSQLYVKESSHSPFNVVAWHGNYLPYKYDLRKFCAVNSVTYDHMDPSIYTVLTVQSDTPGTALADFVIFPPRIMATDSSTLRPPWFHRNTMSEFMGLIQGKYDAKKGFDEGGASLHNMMVPHGPDTAMYDKAVQDPCDSPVFFDGGLAFMFETCLPLRVSPLSHAWLDTAYRECWMDLSDKFTGWALVDEEHEKDAGVGGERG